jgi:ribosome maturation protein SDO1
MVTVEKAIIAKLEKEGKKFEILVDPELAYDYRSGKSVSLQKTLAVNQVFHDAKKGDRAGPADLNKAFPGMDILQIADHIIKHGEIQLTTEFRRKKVEEKRKQVATLISRNAIDPRTRVPHPAERILNAMEQARVVIDAFKPAEQQVDDVLKAIRPILPISIEEISLLVEVPAAFSGGISKVVREYGTASEQWSGDRLVIRVKIPAGLKDKFYSQVGNMTKGNARIEELRK